MKRIQSLLFLISICLWLQACKKSKSEAPTPTPIAVYKLDNKSAKNSMSSLLHGTIKGNPLSAPDSFGVANASLQCNGNDFVEVADSDLLDFTGNQFTFAAWLKPTHGVLQRYIVYKHGGPGVFSPYSLDLVPGVVRAYIYTNTNEQFKIQGTTEIVKNAWQHIAATFDGNKLTIYYNGKSEGSVAVDRPLNLSAGKLNIGHNDNSSSSGLVGCIDNVRIYDRALTAGQINNLYKNYNQ